MWETIRGYLTFTRKERAGVLFLLVLVGVLFVLPYFFRTPVGDPDPETFHQLKSEIGKFESRRSDSVATSDVQARYNMGYESDKRNKVNPVSREYSQMFYFDPNQLDGEGWKRLGITGQLAKTIRHYIDKGGRFRKAEDLKKLYGLHLSDYDRLYPFVRIAPFKKGNDFPDMVSDRMHTEPGSMRITKKPAITDINQADSAAWVRLPGIGSRLASRIVHFRETLGGFYRVEQVGETFGLPDSTFQNIKPVLHMDEANLIQIDLNSATRELLQAHPYIRWQIARAIVDYRRQHGNFHSVDELLQLAGIDSAKFERIRPYVSVKP
jgi:competence protein ComEA